MKDGDGGRRTQAAAVPFPRHFKANVFNNTNLAAGPRVTPSPPATLLHLEHPTTGSIQKGQWATVGCWTLQ